MNVTDKKALVDRNIAAEDSTVEGESLEILKLDAKLAALDDVPESLRDEFKREYERNRAACQGRLACAKASLAALQQYAATLPAPQTPPVV